MPTVTVETSLQLPRLRGRSTGHSTSRRLTVRIVEWEVTVVRDAVGGLADDARGESRAAGVPSLMVTSRDAGWIAAKPHERCPCEANRDG